jgi:hypothetical protein
LHLVIVIKLQECGEKPMFHPQSQWIPETHLLPVRSTWETSAQKMCWEIVWQNAPRISRDLMYLYFPDMPRISKVTSFGPSNGPSSDLFIRTHERNYTIIYITTEKGCPPLHRYIKLVRSSLRNITVLCMTELLRYIY